MNAAPEAVPSPNVIQQMQNYKINGYYPLTHISEATEALHQIMGISSVLSTALTEGEGIQSEVAAACLDAIDIIAALAIYAQNEGSNP